MPLFTSRLETVCSEADGNAPVPDSAKCCEDLMSDLVA